jgi:hypothetical protein
MIRKGRNQSMDQLVTYIVIAGAIAAFIGFYVFLAKKNPGGGMFWQNVVLDETAELDTGNFIRFPVAMDENSRKAAKLVFSIEVQPEAGEVEFGLVGRGQSLTEGNLIGERVNKSIARAPQARKITVTDTAPPGSYDVFVRNVAGRKSTFHITIIIKRA